VAKTPNHMAGINALPRWDRSNPTTYNYDPSVPYDRSDYAAFKRARMERELQTNPYLQNLTAKQRQDFLDGKKVPRGGDVFKQLNRELGNLNKQINKNIHASEDKGKKGPSLSGVKKAAKAGQTLYASAPSTCFSEASWTEGVASLTFANKTQGTWDIEMTLSEWIDFCTGSLGQNFNADWYGA
jgi:hypothetical protein